VQLLSRSGYSDYWEGDVLANLYRGAVKSALQGKRGQAFLKEMLAALLTIPDQRLARDELIVADDNTVCALGAVGKARGLDMGGMDPYDYHTVAGTFNIAEAMAREIMYENDSRWKGETPEQRWLRMCNWIKGAIKDADK
jgi:hypothetical protein